MSTTPAFNVWEGTKTYMGSFFAHYDNNTWKDAKLTFASRFGEIDLMVTKPGATLAEDHQLMAPHGSDYSGPIHLALTANMNQLLGVKADKYLLILEAEEDTFDVKPILDELDKQWDAHADNLAKVEIWIMQTKAPRDATSGFFQFDQFDRKQNRVAALQFKDGKLTHRLGAEGVQLPL